MRTVYEVEVINAIRWTTHDRRLINESGFIEENVKSILYHMRSSSSTARLRSGAQNGLERMAIMISLFELALWD